MSSQPPPPITSTILIWGAGKIGRGFVADLFHAAGYRLILVDQSQELIARLREAGRYTVVRARSSGQREEVIISGYTALSTDQTAQVAASVVMADLLAVAVFPQHFASVACQLAPGLTARCAQRPDAPLDILLCVNLPQAGPLFKAALQKALPPQDWDYLRQRVGIVETLVICMAVGPPEELQAREGRSGATPLLTVWTNGYPDLFVDGRAFKTAIPPVPGLRMVDHMRAAEQRKLYTYNLFQAALAYLGARRGHRLLAESIADPDVRPAAEAALAEACAALQAEFGYSEQSMANWVANVIADTNNPLLGDTVSRVGSDPLRKLRRGDRLVGPALLARKHGLGYSHLARAIAAALHYGAADDVAAVALQDRLAAQDLPAAVADLCGLDDAEQDLIEAIVTAYRRLPLEEEWADRAHQAHKLGFQYEQRYHGCGQCCLAAVLEAIAAADESAFRAATALAGGLGLAGEGAPCSALLGAVLAFGLTYPRRRDHFDDDRENKYRAFAMAQRLRERYLEAYGAITCHEIHRQQMGRAFDLRDPAEREAFELAGAHDDKCTGVVARAAQWAVEIIGQERITDSLRSMQQMSTLGNC